jgi:hypothetical protein
MCCLQSSLMGPSLTIPIQQGRLALGTWQGEPHAHQCSVSEDVPGVTSAADSGDQSGFTSAACSCLLTCCLLMLAHVQRCCAQACT